MNRQNQWLFEAPPALETTHFTNFNITPEYYDPELEFEFGQPVCPTAQSSETISGFGPLQSSIPAGEQGKVDRIASNIVNSFFPNCRPNQHVRVCLIGHADKDPQRGRDFEAKISFARALEVDKALDKAIIRLIKGDPPKFQPIAPLIGLEVLRIGQGADILIVQKPRNEQERKHNRRVKIFLKSILQHENCCSAPRSIAQSKRIYASILKR